MTICDDARKAGIDKIDAALNPLIDEVATIIANMTELGADPRKFYDLKNKKLIDLVSMLSDLGVQKNNQINEVNEKVDSDCQGQMDFLQSVLDLVIASYTKGLSVILPEYMTHIDVAEILSGKPLGGPNSVFNQVRDGIFNTIGIGEDNDLRKVYTNPVETAKGAANGALERAGLPFRF
ncbi:hypothetical protein [Pseudomonas helvetica]|uniref:hypothetical protein n=1 Tax=Pseudomonas helvetica TaxID=3136738 RepID=UPI0032640D18